MNEKIPNLTKSIASLRKGIKSVFRNLSKAYPKECEKIKAYEQEMENIVNQISTDVQLILTAYANTQVQLATANQTIASQNTQIGTLTNSNTTLTAQVASLQEDLNDAGDDTLDPTVAANVVTVAATIAPSGGGSGSGSGA